MVAILRSQLNILAKIFANKDATFVDVGDGDGFDPFLNQNRPASRGDPHNHLYDLTGEKKANSKGGGFMLENPTTLYAPSGFQVVGRGKFKGEDESTTQNYLTLYWAELNGHKDVIIQLWHVEGEIGAAQQDGRTKIGTLGPDGNITGLLGPDGKTLPFASRTRTWHTHINAYTWWGKVRNGKPVGGKGGAIGTKVYKRKNEIKLSDLFCKDLGVLD